MSPAATSARGTAMSLPSTASTSKSGTRSSSSCSALRAAARRPGAPPPRAGRPPVFRGAEPLSNLDAKLRVQMRAELKHLQHELAVTTIYVTHDQIEAMTLATRVAVIHRGALP